MSDGPYKSLPMEPKWKKVALLAENENFSRKDVAERWERALLQEIRAKIPKEVVHLVKKSFERGETELFPDQCLRDLANARRLSHGSPLALLFVDCSQCELTGGNTGMTGLARALNATAEIRSQKAIRQMEEHYWRSPDSSPEIYKNVRNRLREANSELSFDRIASKFLRTNKTRQTAIPIHNSIDDGVPFR